MKLIYCIFLICIFMQLSKAIKMNQLELENEGYDEAMVGAVVDKCWETADRHGYGAITKKQAKTLVQTVLAAVNLSHLWNDLVFNLTFKMVDKDHDGALDREELSNLLNKIMNPTKKAAKIIRRRLRD